MQTLRMKSPTVTSSWLVPGAVGLIGGMLLMLALGLGTGVTRFDRQTVQTVAVSRPALGAPPGKDLAFPDVNLGGDAPAANGGLSYEPQPSVSDGVYGAQPSVSDGVPGGRAGGTNSSDTANDSIVRQGLAPRSSTGVAQPKGCYVPYDLGTGPAGSEAPVGVVCSSSYDLPGNPMTDR